MSTHTPGPWYADGETVRKDIGDCRYVVAEMHDWSEETAPNARLIAAAPELLAALSAMLTYFGMDEDEWSKPVMDKARAAIAKATSGA